jgi:hypothetical protein
LREDLLLPVAHRHVVLTIPRLLRPLFRRRRERLGDLETLEKVAEKGRLSVVVGEGGLAGRIVKMV